MLQIPIRKKARNYPKDFTPPPGYLTSRAQQKSSQNSSTSPYSHINNRSSRGHIINLNQSTQLIENPKESSKNILFTINPQQNSKSHLPDVQKQSPLINQHLGRKMHYINPDLLRRPRIQENSDKQLIQIQQDEGQNSTPGSIRKNLPSQKPLSEQQPNYVHVPLTPSKNIFSAQKLQLNDHEFYQSLKSQYINVSNLKNKKMLSFNKSFQSEPQNSFRLGKRNSDTQLMQSHLQTPKERSEQKKNILEFGYLLEQKRVDKLKAHINQIAFDKSKNKQKISSTKETQADEGNRFHSQRKRPNSNFVQNSHQVYPQLNGQNFQKRSRFDESNYIERFDTQKQSRMRALTTSKQSFHIRGSKKITISYKKTSLNQLKQIFSTITKSQSAEIEISVPNILMNIRFDRNIQKHELYAQASTLFQCLGLPIENITVKRYSNCILMVSKNVCVLWHYDGKVYLGGWQVQYLDQGCKHGLGLQWIPNRHVYYGQFVQSKKQGLGVMKTSDQIYFGEWYQGKKTDNGFSICKNGQVTSQNNQFHRVSNINAEYNGFESDPFL